MGFTQTHLGTKTLFECGRFVVSWDRIFNKKQGKLWTTNSNEQCALTVNGIFYYLLLLFIIIIISSSSSCSIKNKYYIYLNLNHLFFLCYSFYFILFFNRWNYRRKSWFDFVIFECLIVEVWIKLSFSPSHTLVWIWISRCVWLINTVSYPHAFKSGEGSEGPQGSQRPQGLDGCKVWITQRVGHQTDQWDLEERERRRRREGEEEIKTDR